MQIRSRSFAAVQALEGLENSLKVYIGRVGALGDPAFTGHLAAAEAQLRAKSAGNPAIGNPWGDIAKAMASGQTAEITDMERDLRVRGGVPLPFSM